VLFLRSQILVFCLDFKFSFANRRFLLFLLLFSSSLLLLFSTGWFHFMLVFHVSPILYFFFKIKLSKDFALIGYFYHRWDWYVPKRRLIWLSFLLSKTNYFVLFFRYFSSVSMLLIVVFFRFFSRFFLIILILFFDSLWEYFQYFFALTFSYFFTIFFTSPLLINLSFALVNFILIFEKLFVLLSSAVFFLCWWFFFQFYLKLIHVFKFPVVRSQVLNSFSQIFNISRVFMLFRSIQLRSKVIWLFTE